MAAESDLDLAFRLQLEEAVAASLATASTSTAAASTSTPASLDAVLEAALEALNLGLHRLAHDEHFAREILERHPIEPAREADDRPFRLYFKGMESKDYVNGACVQRASLGVAICDPDDKVVIEIQKPVPATEGVGREVMELKALIEGLNAVVVAGIKRIHVFTDFKTLYNHITGRWVVKQRKIGNLMNQVVLLQRKIDQCYLTLLPRCHIKFAFKLAKDAIISQTMKNVESTSNKNLVETCTICLEDTDSSHMFAVDSCLHRFCLSCMKQHVEVKLLHGMLPSCPHDGCETRLNVESSKKFLPAELLNIMVQRIKEASIPVAEKIYCPYPKCSALMSISETICPQQNSSKQSGLRKCIKCSGYFCIKCKVPWHDQMSCYDYKRLNPHHKKEEEKLKSLAKQNLWRQCVKCNHMIELAEGCFHMTCRCGYEFCYTCGAEWKDKKATCSCPLWEEDYIWYDDSDEEYSEGESDDDEFYYDSEEETEDVLGRFFGRR